MTDFNPENPLIVQGDHTVLIEVDNPLYPEARDALARFAELVKSPEHIHTYRITPLSIWNDCAVGETAASIVAALRRFTKYPLPPHIADWLARTAPERLRILLETVSANREKAGSGYYENRRSATLAFNPLQLYTSARYGGCVLRLSPLLETVWSSANEGKFYPLDEWLSPARTVTPRA